MSGGRGQVFVVQCSAPVTEIGSRLRRQSWCEAWQLQFWCSWWVV